MRQSLSLIFLLQSPNSQIVMAFKENVVNKSIAKSNRKNLVVYLGSSTNIDIPPHSYGTRRRIHTLAKT